MALTDQADLATAPGFRRRVLVAAMQAARDVAAEAPSGDESKDLKRAQLAAQILNNPGGYEDRWAWAVAANGAITYASPDSDIQWTVNSLFDAMAGV